jgi:hypothetical protein
MPSEGSTVRIVYVGSHQAVKVPHLRIPEARYGEPLDVSDEAGEALLEQGDNWAAEGSELAVAAAAELKARAERRAARLEAEATAAAAAKAAAPNRRRAAAAAATSEPASPAGSEA